MRDKDGKALLPVWKAHFEGWMYYAAARTRKEAADVIGCGYHIKMTRVKGVFATGKPREL